MPEVFNAISRVKAECNKVSSMFLFQIPITKSMKLEEYEQVQSQTTSQVQFFFFIKRPIGINLKKLNNKRE